MAQYPNYLNNYQPYNPYMDRMMQLQQMGNQFTTLGKVVENIEMVRTADIPMDGNTYYFPKADGTEIYAKQWLQNGQTRILSFKPFSDSKADNSSQSEEKLNLGGIEAFTEVLESKLEDFYKRITTKTRKEVAENE